ncbi:Uncharacterised protein [Raoultella terrigena]|uniref:Uncharacterized protein n=1 Tax=Raoultella terrigena TaxID=577 RepID=A0A3P8M2W2_RAOTE|nr:Uncharacterised protein [Raoultella terrigena]
MQTTFFFLTQLNIMTHQNKRTRYIQRATFPCRIQIVAAHTISHNLTVRHTTHGLFTFISDREINRLRCSITAERTPGSCRVCYMDPTMPHSVAPKHIQSGSLTLQVSKNILQLYKFLTILLCDGVANINSTRLVTCSLCCILFGLTIAIHREGWFHVSIKLPRIKPAYLHKIGYPMTTIKYCNVPMWMPRYRLNHYNITSLLAKDNCCIDGTISHVSINRLKTHFDKRRPVVTC